MLIRSRFSSWRLHRRRFAVPAGSSCGSFDGRAGTGRASAASSMSSRTSAKATANRARQVRMLPCLQYPDSHRHRAEPSRQRRSRRLLISMSRANGNLPPTPTNASRNCCALFARSWDTAARRGPVHLRLAERESDHTLRGLRRAAIGARHPSCSERPHQSSKEQTPPRYGGVCLGLQPLARLLEREHFCEFRLVNANYPRWFRR